MKFVTWLAELIAGRVVTQVIALLREEREAQLKLNAITTEAKSLMGELDAAQSEAEKKAILRKIANFSDAKHLL